jgi:Tfp pilus assembly protein PilW
MRSRLAAEDGFTITELLVAMTAGLAVLAAALVLVGQATTLTSAAQDRVDSAQRARRGVEDMVTELRSGVCVPLVTTAPATTTTKVPMVSGTDNSVTFYANLGTENALPERRVLTFDPAARTIVETRYPATATSTATAVTFATTGTTRTLLENVVAKDSSTPIFTYWKYAVDSTVTPPVVAGMTKLSTAPSGLASADLPFVVQIDIAVRVRPLRATADSKKDAVLQGSATSRLADPLNATQGLQCT